MLRPEPRHRPRPESRRVEERQRLIGCYSGEPRGRSVRFEHVDVFWAGEVVLVDVGEGVHRFWLYKTSELIEFLCVLDFG